jgi:cell surface protein SprA
MPMKPYAGLLIFLFVASAGVCGEGRDFSGSVAGLPGEPAGLEAWELSDSLRFRPYSRHAHLTPEVPAFVKKSALERTYIDLLTERWSKAAGERTFEAKQMSLQDFSKIDIPVKFPKTIGRVIGQGANLSVSGSEQISFGGQSRYRVNEPMTEYGQRSKFPTLDMKQHLKIDLEGTVGEKIHVMVHHDSEIETPLENRIKLRYEGDDDEIVQSIEMGNTNLTLPGSQFVSYSGKQEGLFGAKMLAKLGALDVTAVARFGRA